MSQSQSGRGVVLTESDSCLPRGIIWSQSQSGRGVVLTASRKLAGYVGVAVSIPVRPGGSPDKEFEECLVEALRLNPSPAGG